MHSLFSNKSLDTPLSSETHVFSKPRTIIRNLIQLPETVRKSLLDRRTTVSRVSNFRQVNVKYVKKDLAGWMDIPE